MKSELTGSSILGANREVAGLSSNAMRESRSVRGHVATLDGVHVEPEGAPCECTTHDHPSRTRPNPASTRAHEPRTLDVLLVKLDVQFMLPFLPRLVLNADGAVLVVDDDRLVHSSRRHLHLRCAGTKTASAKHLETAITS